MQRRTVSGLICLGIGTALLSFGGFEIYRTISATSHGLALADLAIVTLGLAAVGAGAERLGFELPTMEGAQKGEVAHSRWATVQDLIDHNVLDQS